MSGGTKGGTNSQTRGLPPLFLHLLLIFALALAVRLASTWPVSGPSYIDEAYSYAVAGNLLDGRGFVEDFIWIYLDNPAGVPHPSHTYWMPLTSIIAWAGMLVFGGTYRGAQVPFAVLSALLAPLAYRLTFEATRSRYLAWVGGLLAIFGGFYTFSWVSVDSFTPFGLSGALAILCGGLALKDGRAGWWFLAGVFGGLGHLARADGPLLLAAPVLLLAWRVWEAARKRDGYAPRRGASSIAMLAAGYLVVMGGWFARNLLTVGAFLPASGSQTIWMTDYDDIFAYGRTFTPAGYLAWGLGNILASKWWSMSLNLQTVFAVVMLIFPAPFALVGFWKLRREPVYVVAAIYLGLLFAVMTFIFTFPGPRGSLFHSGAAVVVYVYAASMVGLESVVGWVAARRKNWSAVQAVRVFAAGFVLLAVLVSGMTYTRRLAMASEAWRVTYSSYSELARWVEERGQDEAPVMLGDAPGYVCYGGRYAVSIPNEPPGVMLEAARRYGVRYVALDVNTPVPLRSLYEGDSALPEGMRPVEAGGPALDESFRLYEVLYEGE